MKVITPEEERAHYNEVLKGGSIGGSLGLGIGLVGVVAASRRFPAVRSLTLPFRAFIVSSVGTFGAIVNAERYSNAFQRANNPMNFYRDQASRDADLARMQETKWERLRNTANENRYTIILTSWAAALGGSIALISRNKYITTGQKIVQARVYAQGLALALILATAVLETADARQGKGRWETIKVVDPSDPEHKRIIEKRIHKEEYEGQDLWRDMVEAEERRLDALKTKKSDAPVTTKKSEE
ncbi:hypothetical protein F5Y17DRAFT_339917 [Xylariaceae sp. FL0594]|nr:hypothetical protein F5Y17DRAFT_339917 [Xylariaceae sp. FL0594]